MALINELQDVVNHFITLFWRHEQPMVLGLALLLIFTLARKLPSDRHSLRQSVVFFLFCLAGQAGAALLHETGWVNMAGGLLELAIIGTGMALIRLFGMLVFRVVLPAMGYAAPRILEDITVILAYFVWGAIRLRQAGMDLDDIVATSAVMTAVIAFAMQDTLGNILGGLAIHMDHSVSIGDWVVLDGVSGKVSDIRWRYTKVITRNGEIVVVPNSVLMKNRFTVISAQDGAYSWRRWVWFGVPYQWSPAQVIEVVEQALGEADISRVARSPAPQCILHDFASGYGNYALRYWLTDPQVDDPTDSVVRQHIFAALQRAGMRLAVPEETRRIIRETRNGSRKAQNREVERRLEALRDIDLFADLTEKELSTLAEQLHYTPYAAGDVMTLQGAQTQWLYILVEGEAEVWVEGPAGRHRVTTLAQGSVFGEMGLMTGTPLAATLKAKTAVECYRLDKASVEHIIRARPAIAENLSSILAERRQALEQFIHHQDSTPEAPRDQANFRAEILGRMRKFFALNR